MDTKDPLIEATVKVLSEGSDMSRFLRDTVAESRDYHFTDVIQVAVALLDSAGRRARIEDARIGDKLQIVARQLDRLVDSY